MDKIKGFINSFTGGDNKVDTKDMTDQVGGLDLSSLGINDLSDFKAKMGDFDISKVAGLNFPITKGELVLKLKSANAPDVLTSVIEKLPNNVIESLNELRTKLPI